MKTGLDSRHANYFRTNLFFISLLSEEGPQTPRARSRPRSGTALASCVVAEASKEADREAPSRKRMTEGRQGRAGAGTGGRVPPSSHFPAPHPSAALRWYRASSAAGEQRHLVESLVTGAVVLLSPLPFHYHGHFSFHQLRERQRTHLRFRKFGEDHTKLKQGLETFLTNSIHLLQVPDYFPSKCPGALSSTEDFVGTALAHPSEG